MAFATHAQAASPRQSWPYSRYEETGQFDNQIVKCVVVGDTGVGKTRLICARACGTCYTLRQLMQTHAPTVWAIDHYRKDREVYGKSWCTVDNVHVSLQLWDTFGYHDKDRKFAYAKADVVLLCFSVVRPRSLRNIVRHWLPEIRQSSSGVPIIICGTQIDLRYLYIDQEFIRLDKGPFYRDITKDDIVTPSVGRETANEVGALSYYETSVLVPIGIEHTFENVIRVALSYKREKHFWNLLNNSLKRVRKPQVQEPFLPPHPVAPTVEVSRDDWQSDINQMLQNQTYCDLVFKSRQGTRLQAHKVIVGTAVVEIQKLLLLTLETEPANESASNKVATSGSCHSKVSEVKTHDQETVRLLDSLDSDVDSIYDGQSKLTSDKACVFLDHPVFHSVEQDGEDGGHCTVLTLNDNIEVGVFQHLLAFMYTWRCSEEVVASTELIAQVRKIAEMLDFQQMLRYLCNISYHEDYLNSNLTSTSVSIHQHKLFEFGLRQGYYSDVVFDVEGGRVKAHKALLVARSDMMSCMFSNNFMESSAKVVKFPGVTKHVFSSLLQYLYTGGLSQLAAMDLLELMELANRLCLPRLQAVAEDMVVGQLQRTVDDGRDIFEETVQLLEPAQLHNATQLADYCLWYLTCNYLQLHNKHSKLRQSLHPDNQVLLNQRRWPPVWYLREYEYYEKCQLDLERQKQSARRVLGFHSSGTESPNQGCLAFCGRRRRKIKCTQRVEESVSV